LLRRFPGTRPALTGYQPTTHYIQTQTPLLLLVFRLSNESTEDRMELLELRD
jgi:hypothetical protein